MEYTQIFAPEKGVEHGSANHWVYIFYKINNVYKLKWKNE